MDPRGQVSLGKSDTGAAAVSNAYEFAEKQQAKESERAEKIQQDIRKIKAANRQLGDKAIGILSKTDLPYWNTQSTRDIKSELESFKAKTRDLQRNDVPFYDDEEWISKHQRLQDIILMESEHKKNYISILSTLQEDFEKGDEGAYDYEKSMAGIQKYSDASHDEREKMDPYKLIVPKEKEYSKDDFFSKIKPKDITITNDTPEARSVVSKPDVEAMTAEAKTKAGTKEGKAVLDYGIKKGWWKDEADMVSQSVNHQSKFIKKDASYTKKKEAAPKYIKNGKVTKTFTDQASFDVPITKSNGRNYSSPVVMPTSELGVTIPAGSAIDSKTDKKLDKAQNIKLMGGQLIYTDDFKIMWKGTALKEGSESADNRVDVMVEPQYINHPEVKDQEQAMKLYLEQRDKPATADEF